MELQEVLAAAEEFLKVHYRGARSAIVLRPEWAREQAWAWEVTYDTQERPDTGDAVSGDSGQGSKVRLVVVPKDGSRVRFMPSAFSYEMQQAYLATGQLPKSTDGGTRSAAPGGHPIERATAWVRETYGPLVELAVPYPVAESPHAWLFSVRTVRQEGYRPTPMLNATVVVPRDGGAPFHPANADPWGDVAALAQRPGPRRREDWAFRTNARGCVVSVDAGIDGGASTALPWKPADEAPGWWKRLVQRHFSGAAGPQVRTRCDWDTVLDAVRAGGAGTRGVVWVRRTLGGHEATGHLLYVFNDGRRVTALDGQSGGLARLETENVLTLTLALFHREIPSGPGAPSANGAPWEQPAPDLTSALGKAMAWLGATYPGEEVVLAAPTAADDLGRGWLFACNTHEFLQRGDWRRGMLDAAVVVPKDGGAPFGLPNSDPWRWLTAWLQGGEPGVNGLDPIPLPGPAAWLTPTLAQLGPLLESFEYRSWPELLAALVGAPDGLRALVWVRRRDARGRESTGLLVNVSKTAAGLTLIDPMRDAAPVMESVGVLSLRLIRYR